MDYNAAALEMHAKYPGKLIVNSLFEVKDRDALSTAYTPGVAEPCRQIKANPDDVYKYTFKGRTVAVITNGTAVLGLGNIGPLAGKPVMEGKGMLFKMFADVDVFDLELATTDPDELINVVKTLEPTFGGINLEDIKAPECFYIEQKLKEIMNIPVFHDDQHGTAVISGAGLINAAHIAGRKMEDMKVVVVGAGAAGIACANFYVSLGVKRENIWMFDSKGLIHKGRQDKLHPTKAAFAQEKDATLAEAMQDAHVFLGLSKPGLVTQDMVRSMASHPVIFACANPVPEITYAEAKAARGGQTILQSVDVVVIDLRLAVRLDGLALGDLTLEAALLVDGVVQLAEGVAVLGAVDEILEALGEGRVARLALGQRTDLDGIVVDEGGLDELILNEGVEELGQNSALGGHLRQLHMVLLCGSDGILVGLPVVEIHAGILLDRLDHGQALPVAHVDLLTLIGDDHAAADLLSQTLVQLFHQIHHAVEIGKGLIQLDAGELGVVLGVHALVAEDAADLIHAVHAADDQALQRKLGRDTHIHIDIERIVVRDKGSCRRAARVCNEHGGFNLHKAL